MFSIKCIPLIIFIPKRIEDIIMKTTRILITCFIIVAISSCARTRPSVPIPIVPAPISTGHSVSLGGSSVWHSLDPRECAGEIEDDLYLQMISDATLRGDSATAQRLLDEYAEIQRCDKSVGNNQVAYSLFTGSEKELMMEASSNNLNSEFETISTINEPPKERSGSFNEDFHGLDTSEKIAAQWIVACIANATMWQTHWRLGEWTRKIRIRCTGPAIGSLETVWGGKQVEGNANGRIIRSMINNFNLPFGGTAVINKKFYPTLPFVLKWHAPASFIKLKLLGGAGGSSSKSFSSRPINKKGRSYPKISTTPRPPVIFPDAPPKMNPPVQRAANFTTLCKRFYRQQGWAYPLNNTPGQISYQNHHIRPLRWAGPNAGNNCYRLSSGAHHYFSVWWLPRSNFKTPVSQ